MRETPAEQAMEMVRRLEESGALGAGGRLPALLRYLVQEELAGRGDRLKAYSIATEVLGRGETFDPAQDSIVRVEIGRLRKPLDLFYATQGKDEPVRIDIPKGASRPRITFGDGAEPPGQAPPDAPDPPRRWLYLAVALVALAALGGAALVVALRSPPPRPALTAAGPKLILLPVRVQGADPDLGALALGLRAQLAAELSRQPWLTVLTLDAVEPQEGETKLFAAEPLLIRDGGGYVLSAQLTSEPDRAVKWSAQYRDARLHEPLADLASGLAGGLARDLGYPLGPIGQAVGAKSSATDAEVEDQFLCMMNAYRYWRDGAPKQAADARACLTRLTARDADFATGRAALALLSVEDARARDGAERQAALARAAALLRGAPEDDRLSLTARLKLSACGEDVHATTSLAHALAAAAPNDPDSLAEAAYAAAFGALDWEFALGAQERAQKLARRPRPFYSHPGAARATLAQDFDAALAALSRAPQQGDALGQTMLLILAKLVDAPSRAAGAAAALGPTQSAPDALRTTLDRACWRPEIKAAFIQALGKAPWTAPPASATPGR